MGIFDYLIIGAVVIGMIAAIRYMKKNGLKFEVIDE